MSGWPVGGGVTSGTANYVDLRQFGTLDRTGTLDMASIIQTAINSLNPTNSTGSVGGTLFIPHGIYLVKTSIELKANVTLIGEGWGENAKGSEIIAGAAMAQVVLMDSGSALQYMSIADNLFCTASTVTVGDGTGAGAGGGVACSIWDSLVHGTSSTYTGAALWVRANSNRIQLNMGRFENTVPGQRGIAVLLDSCFDAQIVGCRFSGGNALKVLGSDGHNLTDVHFNQAWTAGDGADLCNVLVSGSGCTFTGCEFDNAGSTTGNLIRCVTDATHNCVNNNFVGGRLLYGNISPGIAVIQVDSTPAGGNVANNNLFQAMEGHNQNGGANVPSFILQIKAPGAAPLRSSGTILSGTFQVGAGPTTTYDTANSAPAQCGGAFLH